MTIPMARVLAGAPQLLIDRLAVLGFGTATDIQAKTMPTLLTRKE